jgi:hypothetical protein
VLQLGSLTWVSERVVTSSTDALAVLMTAMQHSRDRFSTIAATTLPADGVPCAPPADPLLLPPLVEVRLPDWAVRLPDWAVRGAPPAEDITGVKRVCV